MNKKIKKYKAPITLVSGAFTYLIICFLKSLTFFNTFYFYMV
jgi:hypothetical protein